MPDTSIIEDALAAWLADLPCVRSLAGGRVYPFGAVDQDTLWPFVTYFRISGGRVRSLRGWRVRPEKARTGHPLIQVDAWGRTYAEAKRLWGAVLEELDDFSGDMGGFNVQVARVPDDRDRETPPPHGDQATQFGVGGDVRIWFTERRDG